MRKIVLVLFLIWLTAAVSWATVIDGGAWAEFYGYKVKLPGTQSHLRSLQGLRLSVTDAYVPGLKIYMRGRVASDLIHKLPSDSDFRVYGGYLEYTTPNRWLMARAGRQFVFAGLGGITIDGGKIDISHKDVTLTGYAGSTPGPSFFDLDEVGSWKKSNAYGGRLKYTGVKRLTAGASFQQRNFDDNLDSQLGGLDLAYSMKRCTFYGRGDYDFFFKRFQLVSIRPTFRLLGGHYVNFEYLYRHRSLPLHSMFSVFDNKPYNQFRVNPVIKLKPQIYALGTFTYTKYENDDNVNFSLGASYRGQSAGFFYGDGYGGKQVGGFANLSYCPIQKLQVYLQGNSFDYKLDDSEADYTPSLAGALGANYELVTNLQTRAEVQLLSNRDYKYDTRFYLRLEYFLKRTVNRTIGGDGR
jgi:hypothetical protein